MPSGKTVNLDTHAMATLRYIRESMDAAVGVAVPGSAGVAMGTVGLAATTLSLVPQLAAQWFLIWLIAAPVAAVTGAFLMAGRKSVLTFVGAGQPGRKLLLGLMPSLFAGAVMTAVLWKADYLAAAPGIWLLLYGCALISASAFTKVIVRWMGGYFVALGVLALLTPPAMQIALLGLGFGGVHIAFGVVIARGPHAH